jgi:hypothetical protein
MKRGAQLYWLERLMQQFVPAFLGQPDTFRIGVSGYQNSRYVIIEIIAYRIQSLDPVLVAD